MELLRGYGMEPNLARILENHWKHNWMVPMVGKFLGTVFGTGRGVTYVNPAYSMIFDIVVDAVVWSVLEKAFSL